ncbi:MAG: selenium metabolism-associated LysR family transcriptional regulator [Desulfobacterales bacterium]
MDLWQLHIFCRVVETRSFSKAAERVRLSQPTVSSHIKDLEDHFGCPLIDRLSRQALPTQAGELLYGYALRLLALRDEIEAVMARYQGKSLGRLTVGGSTIPGGYLLPQIVGRFQKRHPGVTLALVVADTGEIIRRVLEGTLELGVVGAAPRNRQLVHEMLLADRLQLVVPRNHPWASRREVPFSLLQQEPFILREEGSGTRQAIEEALRRAGRGIGDLRVVAEMGSTEAVRQAIREGVGVSILSELAVREDLAAGRLAALRVAGLALRRHFHLIHHRQRQPGPLAVEFTAFLKESLASRHADGP